MKIGTRVRWKSQAGGNTKVKEGIIVAIIGSEQNPRTIMPAGMWLDSDSYSRVGESYLVQVGNSRALYWPRANHLHLIEEV